MGGGANARMAGVSEHVYFGQARTILLHAHAVDARLGRVRELLGNEGIAHGESLNLGMVTLRVDEGSLTRAKSLLARDESLRPLLLFTEQFRKDRPVAIPTAGDAPPLPR
jgi:hypothetical protein